MPTVAIVDGVSIVFYTNEHPPPHFHAKFAEHQAVIDLDSMRVTEGFLPVAKRRKVLAWATERRGALLAAFAVAVSREPVGPIE